jgi:hypothetical protein
MVGIHGTTAGIAGTMVGMEITLPLSTIMDMVVGTVGITAGMVGTMAGTETITVLLPGEMAIITTHLLMCITDQEKQVPSKMEAVFR